MITSEYAIQLIELGLDRIIEASKKFSSINTEEELRNSKNFLIGEEGELMSILEMMKDVDPDNKRAGLRINEAVTHVQLAFEYRLLELCQKKDEQEADTVMVYVRNLDHDFGVFKRMKEDGLLNDLIQKLPKEKIFNLYKRYDVKMYELDGRLHILLDDQKFHEIPSDNGAWIKPEDMYP